MKDYDLLIIGGGPGGYVAAIKGSQLGLSVGLVERDKVGGACLHRGCIPTKALIQSTHLYELCKRSKEYGVVTEGVSADFSGFHKRKNLVVNRLFGGIEHLLKKNKVDLLKGTGQTTSSEKVLVREGDKIKDTLAEVLLGAIVQQLLPRRGGGEVTVMEILVANSASKALIKESRFAQITSIIQASRDEGMRSLDQALIELIKTGEVDYHDALSVAVDKTNFQVSAQKFHILK